MRTLGFAMLGMLLCAPLCAREQGDFTPRGALVHARIADLQGVLKKLGGGEDYLAPLERIWAALRKRDAEEGQALVDELRPYLKAATSIEFALGDIMLREPYTQTVTVIELGEGAPAEFSEAVRKWVKQQDKKAVAEPTAIDIEAFSFRRYPGQLVITTGGMQKFVDDVRGGNLEESISKVKRFKDWRENAQGDLVAYADMKAWRNCIDRLGPDADRELLSFLQVLEWQKWETITLSVDVSNGIAARADLTLSEPLGALNALVKGAGGFTLFDSLPAETLAALALQLGSDHERTYGDLLKFFHDTEWRMRRGSLLRRIENYKNALADIERNLAGAESEEDKKNLAQQAESYRREIQSLEEELANSKDAPRPFEPDREERRRKMLRASDAEEFSDGFDEFCKESGLTREALFEALGSEAVAGIVGLPDPMPDDNDFGNFRDLWFVMARAKGDLKSIKEKFLAALNKERQPREGEERAQPPLIGKPVEGGELIAMEGGPGATLFIGEGLVGLAANSEVAKRILLANIGRERLSYAKMPGGAPSASKAVFIDAGEMIARMVDGDSLRRRRWGYAPTPLQGVRKYLPNGLRLCLTDSEGPSRIGLSLFSGGELSLRSFLLACAEDIEFDRAWRHDRNELQSLADGCEAWFSANQEALSKMEAGDRRDAIKAVTLQALLKHDGMRITDGLRSCFDPAMADAFKAMLKERRDALADGDKARDISEAGFEWFGLATDEVKTRSDDRGSYDTITDAWLVAASKGPWVSGGRICVVQSGLNYRVVWLSEDHYNAVKLANVSGGRIKTFRHKQAQPLWKVKVRLWQRKYELEELKRAIAESIVDNGSFKEFRFKGSEHAYPAEALAALIEAFKERYWIGDESAAMLEVEAKDKSIKVRFVLDGQWIEVDENGKVTTSWADE